VSARSIALGGVLFRLQGPAGRLDLPAVYGQFVASSSDEPSAVYEVLDASDEIPPIVPGTVAWSCQTWRIGRNAGGRWTIEIACWPEETWRPVADAAPDFSSARLVPRAGRRGDPSPYALNYPVDQALIVNRLLNREACILHGSGVLYEGRALLFIGRSGIGKTTLARLWRGRGAILLNDDRMILRRDGDRILLASSPWHGEERAVHNATAPLGAIFHLNQAAENQLTPLPGAAAASRLIANAVAPFYSGTGLQRLTELAGATIDRVPCWSLAFAPTAAVVDDCLQVIAATAG
jgi:hypothetical protein